MEINDKSKEQRLKKLKLAGTEHSIRLCLCETPSRQRKKSDTTYRFMLRKLELRIHVGFLSHKALKKYILK